MKRNLKSPLKIVVVFFFLAGMHAGVFAPPPAGAAPAVAPVITSANNTIVVSGAGGTFQVTAAGTAPIAYSLTDAPAGVGIDGSTGLMTIAGSVAANAYSFTITASNGVKPDAVQSFALGVRNVPVAPTITSANKATVSSGTGGTFQVSAVGTAPITYGLSGAPTQVSINGSTGLMTIAATTAVGNHRFTVTASNDVSPKATQRFTLEVTGGGSSGGGCSLNYLGGLVFLVASGAVLLKKKR